MFQKPLLIIAIILPTHAWANSWHDTLKTYSQKEQTRILEKMTKASGYKCSASDSRFLFLDNGEAYYLVECWSGKDYAIRILNDSKGTMKVLDCDLMKSYLNEDVCPKHQ